MANEVSTFRASAVYIENDGERIRIDLDGVTRIIIEVPSPNVKAVLADDTTFMAASDELPEEVE